MSKKRTGLWIAFGAVLGAAAAGISYYLKYKSFNDELEQDFHDYEEEEDAKEEKKQRRRFLRGIRPLLHPLKLRQMRGGLRERIPKRRDLRFMRRG